MPDQAECFGPLTALAGQAINAEVSEPEVAEFAAGHWQWSEEPRYVQAA